MPIILALGALLTWPESKAQAYSCSSSACPAYCQSPVSFRLANPSQDLGLQATVAELKKGMEIWTQAECSGLKVQYGGTTTEAPASGNGVVSWEESDWSSGSGTIGITTTRISRDCITSHMSMNGVNFRWVAGTPGRGEVHALTIIAHEGGHYVGLGHSTIAGAVMSAQYRGGIVPLNRDDEEGICTIYPGGGGGAVPDPPRPAPGGMGGGGMAGASGAPANGGQGGQRAGGQGGQRTGGNGGMGSGGSSASPTPVCSQDSQCGANERCANEKCVPDEEDQIVVADGQHCEVNEDCQSQLCLEMNNKSFCSRLCTANSDCVSGFRCQRQGDEKLCLAIKGGDHADGTVPDFTNDNPVRGGCSMAGGAGRHGGLWVVTLLGLVGILGFRRKGGSSAAGS